MTEEGDGEMFLDVGGVVQSGLESGVAKHDIHEVIDAVAGDGMRGGGVADIAEDIHKECGGRDAGIHGFWDRCGPFTGDVGQILHVRVGCCCHVAATWGQQEWCGVVSYFAAGGIGGKWCGLW
jgi:hypothetical protein